MEPPAEANQSPEAKRYGDALRLAREGVPRALDEVIAELSPMMWRVARKSGLDHQTAEDVVQASWLALIKSLDTIDNPAALPGWLAQTARRESWRVSKQIRREHTADRLWDEIIDEQPDLDEDIAERMDLAPHYKALWKVVGELSELCRALIQVVAFVDKPNYEEVAKAVGLKRSAIGPNRGRCLAKLRELLHSNPEWIH